MHLRRTRLFFIILAGWVGFGGFLTLQMYLFHPNWIVPYSFGTELSWELTLSLIWAASTPLILWLCRRFPIERTVRIRRVSLHLLLSFCLSLVECALHGIIIMATRVPIERWTMAQLLPSLFYNIDKMMMVYWIIVFVDQFLLSARRLKEQELRESQLKARLATAQLQALRMQLRPHFLFNTLNAVTTLLNKDPRAAERMIVRLGDFLRATLDDSGRQLVPLRDEIQFLRSYLEIEQIRFQDRLSVSFDLPEETLDIPVPNLVLQPLAENAIRHGLAPSLHPGRIQIVARRENGTLELSVIDNGAGICPGEDHPIREGVGIGNTRARLAQLYASAASLTLKNGEHGGATAVVRIPIRPA
jgi:LytS/YehU family sensor histidine kinase